MAPLLLYSTCAVGAVGLYLVLRPGPRSLRLAGALLGLAALVYLGVSVARLADGRPEGWSGPESPLFLSIFCLITVAGAVRVVTHPRPVYAALYFVLTVVSSAAIFLMLQAEFMAFALVIVYAGAILITYLFVLMLAHEATQEHELSTLAEYDRVPREPATAVIVGLVLVAVLAQALFGSTVEGERAPGQPAPSEDVVAAADREWRDLDLMPRKRDALLRQVLAEIAPDLVFVGGAMAADEAIPPTEGARILQADGRTIQVRDGRAFVDVLDASGQRREIALPEFAIPGNTQRVGLALVADFPVSLELAGVLLTMAMFGAVVLARRQAEFGEDQRRAAAGLSPVSVDREDPPARSGTPATAGGRP